MLFHPNGANKPLRLQCAFVSDEEVERIVNYFRGQQQQPQFDEQVISNLSNPAKGGATGRRLWRKGSRRTTCWARRCASSLESGQASISMIQRRLPRGAMRARPG